MTTTTRDTYRIGTDTLPGGKVRARARGTKKNTLTIPAPDGFTATREQERHAHQVAARRLAEKIEGADLHPEVTRASEGPNRSGHYAADWIVSVTA